MTRPRPKGDFLSFQLTQKKTRRPRHKNRGLFYFGKAEGERIFGLELLMKKYQPEGGFTDFPAEKLAITGFVRIDVEEMVGKEDLAKDDLKLAAMDALDKGVPLPIVLERN